MSNAIRPVPRLLGPRLPIGPRWLRFCRSQFAEHLRASVQGVRTSLVLISGVVTFYVGINVTAGLYLALGGTL
ncbi:hypothetical protein [Blastococcus saxobsidens]|uniref:Uncharacterized protein n=1 Tax=Blastococcus saxobsidens TaxID=138336 RepID=A0A4Q7Y3S7_9ACTN|nr:hypothetical protein [Blastococcus saxobsidens]RZU30485.1 hypothetical protein BKA19_0101 [Blastococcus saxobsidens]